MERFVFGLAIFVAVIFAIGAVFGGPDFRGWHFEFDDADASPAALVELAPGQMAAQTFATDRVRVRYVAARVVVTPEDRTDVSVEIDNSAGRTPMPEVSLDDDRVEINGLLRGRIEDCTAEGAELRGYDAVTLADMPLITIRVPRDVDVDLGGAGTTEIGASNSLELDHRGCSSVNVGDVAGEANIDLAGSGEITMGSAASLNADVAGSGRINTGVISGDANVDIAGSGTVNIAALNGALETDGAGSGNVVVNGGAVTRANIDLAGSGDVEINTSVSSLDVSIVGSGDVNVNGVVGTIDAEIAGSGEVSVQSATGAVRQQVFGSGQVRVGGSP